MRNTVSYMLLCCGILCGAMNAFGAPEFPAARGAVNDFADVLSPGVEQQMEQVAVELLQKTGAALVVVTMPTIGEEEYTDYANRLFENWGIGQKGSDRGVLILDVVDIRRIRIEVGYGLEGIIPDGLAGEIRDRYMVPYLRSDDFDNGLGQGFAAIAGIIAQDAGVTLTGLPAPADVSRRGNSGRNALRGLVPLILLLFLLTLFRGRRGGSGGLLPLIIMGSMMGGRRGGWGGGGFGGGGGGFSGGFGGGLSGGGGAGGGY